MSIPDDGAPIDTALATLPPVLAQRLQALGDRSDFPAMSAQVMRVYQLAGNEHEKLHRLTDEILKDVALTNRLLRWVNSARYAGRLGGVGTVSRAVSMIGFTSVRNLALGLVLLEHMDARGQKRLVQEAYARALFAAMLAREWCVAPQEAEEAFLGALMQGLGRMLVACYFPAEAQAIQTQAAAAPDRERRIAEQVLGVGYEALGAAVARSWGLPDATLRAMDRVDGVAPSRMPADPVERVRWIAASASRTVDALWVEDPSRVLERVHVCCRQHAAVLGRPVQALVDGFQAARQKMVEMVEVIGLPETAGGAVGQWLRAGQEAETAGDGARSGGRVLEDGRPKGAALEAHPPSRLAWALTQALQDVTGAMADARLSPAVTQRLLLEALCTALSCRAVVLCEREKDKDGLRGVRGLGFGGEPLAQLFEVPMGQPEDLFAVLCRQPRDTWIEDARQPSVMGRLPAWFRNATAPRSMLILPLRQHGHLVGMVYAEDPQLPSRGLSEEDTVLLRVIKNLWVMSMTGRG